MNQDARESQRYKARSQHLYEAAIKISKYTRHLEKMFKKRKQNRCQEFDGKGNGGIQKGGLGVVTEEQGPTQKHSQRE